MPDTIEMPNTVVTFPWKGTEETGAHVFQLHIDTIIKAMRLNAGNPVILQEIKRAGICIQWEADRLIHEAGRMS